MKRIPSCRSDRKKLLKIEEDFKKKDPSHKYTTDLSRLQPYSDRVMKDWNCYDGGTYTVVVNGNKIKILCTARDHEPVHN